jgi:hypothetical protein
LFVLCEGGGDPVKFFFYIHHETASPALAQFHFLEKKIKDINEPKDSNEPALRKKEKFLPYTWYYTEKNGASRYLGYYRYHICQKKLNTLNLTSLKNIR